MCSCQATPLRLVIWSAFFLCFLSKTVLAMSGTLKASSERLGSFGELPRINHLRMRSKAGKARSSKKGKKGRGKKASAPQSATPSTTSPSFLSTSSPSQARRSKKSGKGKKGKKTAAPLSPAPGTIAPSCLPTQSPSSRPSHNPSSAPSPGANESILTPSTQIPSATSGAPSATVTTLLDDELNYTVGLRRDANGTYNETKVDEDIRNATIQILATIPPYLLLSTRRHLLGLHRTTLKFEDRGESGLLRKSPAVFLRLAMMSHDSSCRLPGK